MVVVFIKRRNNSKYKTMKNQQETYRYYEYFRQKTDSVY